MSKESKDLKKKYKKFLKVQKKYRELIDEIAMNVASLIGKDVYTYTEFNDGIGIALTDDPRAGDSMFNVPEAIELVKKNGTVTVEDY